MLRDWEKRILERKTRTGVTILQEAEEKKQGLIERIWEELPPAKLSGNTYVKFNENLGKPIGRDNPIDELSLNIENKLDLADYKFL